MKQEKIDYSELGKERIITVADLIREIGRRIWIVIVLAAAFALIFGAYKYYRDVQSAKRTTDLAITVAAESSLTDEEVAEVKNVLYVKDNLDDLQNYVDNSVLMQIDAANESRVILQYRVKVSNERTAGMTSRDVMLLYQGFISNGALASGLVDAGYDLDVQYLQELLDFADYSDSNSIDNSDAEEATEATASFILTITQTNQTTAEQLADMIEEQLEAYQDTLTNQIGRHDLTLIDRSYSRVVNANRRTYKYDRINNIITIQDKLDELETNLTTAQQELLKQYEERGYTAEEELESNIELDGNVNSTQLVKVHISSRYVAIGALIGIVIAFVYIILAYIMRGSINSANDIRYLYDLRVLGEVKTSGNKKIRKGRMYLSYDQQIDLLITNLKSVCKENGLKKIMFNGNDKLEANQKLAESFNERMKKSGIQIEYVTNLPYSASALELLEDCKAVVLLEKIRYSDYRTMEAEIRTCMEHDAKIVGTVVFS